MLCRRCDDSVQLALLWRRTGAFDPFPEIVAGPLGATPGHIERLWLRALADRHLVVGQRTRWSCPLRGPGWECCRDPTWVSCRRSPVDGARRASSPAVSGHGPALPQRPGSPRTSVAFAGQDRDARSGTGRTSVQDPRVEGATVCAICPRRRGQRHLPRPRSARRHGPPTADSRRRAAPRGVLVQTCGFQGSPLSARLRSGSPRDRGEPQWRRPGTGSVDPKERSGHEGRGVRCRCARSVRDVCCRQILVATPYWRSRGSPLRGGAQRSRGSGGCR